MFCSAKSLTIKVGDYYIVCPREGGQIKAENFQGTLLCPDYNLICTNKILCNNLLDCLEKNSEDKESEFDYDYTIKTTQDPSVYNATNPDISYGYELANDGSCPYLCMQCTSKTSCEKCLYHYKFENNECIYAVEHCTDFESLESDKCTSCNGSYYLAEDSTGNRYCTDSINEYYELDSTLK